MKGLLCTIVVGLSVLLIYMEAEAKTRCYTDSTGITICRDSNGKIIISKDTEQAEGSDSDVEVKVWRESEGGTRSYKETKSEIEAWLFQSLFYWK